jgi:hypothetical protein
MKETDSHANRLMRFVPRLFLKEGLEFVMPQQCQVLDEVVHSLRSTPAQTPTVLALGLAPPSHLYTKDERFARQLKTFDDSRALMSRPALPEAQKDLRFVVKIRVYGEGYKTHLSHAFCVDDMPSGVSAPVGELVIDVRTVTLDQLRPMIMYDIRGAMKRRSMLWQEVLYIFGRLPNIYDRPRSEVNKYQFGFVRKSKLEDIKLIHPSRENEPIANLIGATDFFSHDLVIVPLTQISPEVEKAPPPPQTAVSNNLPAPQESSEPVLEESSSRVPSAERKKRETQAKDGPPKDAGGKRASSPKALTGTKSPKAATTISAKR